MISECVLSFLEVFRDFYKCFGPMSHHQRSSKPYNLSCCIRFRVNQSTMSIQLLPDINFIMVKDHFYFQETFNFLSTFVRQRDALV